MVLKCFLCSTEIGFTWVVDQIASADFLIKLNEEKREKWGKKESQRLHLSYLIKVPTEINIEKSSVLPFFLPNLIFGWCVTSVSTSRAAASTSTETSAQELPASACVSDSPFTARRLCLPKNKCHKSTKKSTHAPQNAVSTWVHLHDSVFGFHPLWLHRAFKAVWR